MDFYCKTNKEASTVLCSVIKHLGSGYSTQEAGRNTRLSARVSPYRFFRALAASCVLTTEQNIVEASLFVKY